MVARGFEGEIHVMQQTTFRTADVLFIVGCSVFFVTARTWNLAAGLGRLITEGRP
jgi:energy-coupling factor transporter transmembrane protein EcfT